MRSLRVLLACDIATNGTGNPYTLQLLHALEAHPDVASVQHGTSWMRVPEIRFDVVHLQWPEALTRWNEPSESDLRTVKSALERWSAEAAVVVTVHNEHPHYRDTPAFRELYRTVYAHAAGLVHLGEASRRLVRQRFEQEIATAKEAVIPHGNYDWFPNEVSRQASREALAVASDANVVLTFGRIRAMEEVELLRRGFGTMRLPRRRLLVAGRLPHGKSRRNWRYWTVRVPIWAHPHMQRVEKFVAPDRVQLYLNAADVLVVPRRKVLNSGNVALGFTFGRVVVGPDRGVVGEVLRRTGNPVFDPADPRSLGEALREGMTLAREGQGHRNRDYATEMMSWGPIAEQHVALYQGLQEAEVTDTTSR